MTTTAPVVTRLSGLDRLRGAAIIAMVIDHVALFAGVEELRLTVGRIAVPLFFLVSGALVTRFTVRHALIGLVGCILPLWVQWIDNPNVLLWYALGAGLLVVARRVHVGAPVVVAVVMLTLLANGWGGVDSGYPFAALWALMALGQIIGRAPLASVGDRLPSLFTMPGRYPLSFYVGHLLVIDIVAVAIGWGIYA